MNSRKTRHPDRCAQDSCGLLGEMLEHQFDTARFFELTVLPGSPFKDGFGAKDARHNQVGM